MLPESVSANTCETGRAVTLRSHPPLWNAFPYTLPSACAAADSCVTRGSMSAAQPTSNCVSTMSNSSERCPGKGLAYKAIGGGWNGRFRNTQLFPEFKKFTWCVTIETAPAQPLTTASFLTETSVSYEGGESMGSTHVKSASNTPTNPSLDVPARTGMPKTTQPQRSPVSPARGSPPKSSSSETGLTSALNTITVISVIPSSRYSDPERTPAGSTTRAVYSGSSGSEAGVGLSVGSGTSVVLEGRPSATHQVSSYRSSGHTLALGRLNTPDGGSSTTVAKLATHSLGQSSVVIGSPSFTLSTPTPTPDQVVSIHTLPPGQTIAPDGSSTLSGDLPITTMAFTTGLIGENGVVVGSSVMTRPPTTPPSAGYVVGGDTITLGGSITLGSASHTTIIALTTNSVGQKLLVVGGSISMLPADPSSSTAPGLGGYIISGLGGTSATDTDIDTATPAAYTGAAAYRSGSYSTELVCFALVVDVVVILVNFFGILG